MGKGKGHIDHYVTPVKAGRILIEVGGTIDFPKIEPILQVSLSSGFWRANVPRQLPVDPSPCYDLQTQLHL